MISKITTKIISKLPSNFDCDFKIIMEFERILEKHRRNFGIIWRKLKIITGKF